MKKLLCALSCLSFAFATVPAQADDVYKFDPNHSYVLWHINHFGFSNPSGKWFANGTISLNAQKPMDDKVTVDIKVANVITGIPELDKHLQGPLFFDTAKFSNATFVSDHIVHTGFNTSIVKGNLTVHGVTKPITLFVRENKMGINPISNLQTVGYTAHTVLKRSDFGINTLLPDLSDKVTIDIEVEANKALAKKPS